MPNLTSMLTFITTDQSPVLPPATARRLVISVVGALAVAGGTVAALLSLAQKPDWMRGFIAAGVVSVLASVLSLIPLLWGVRRTLNTAIAGFFVAMAVRLAVSVGGVMLAIHAGGYPQTPTLLLMAVFYVVVLTAESLVVALATWSMEGKK